MTDVQSASLVCNKTPTWDIRPNFYYCQTVAGLLVCGALSEERTDLSFTISAGARQRCNFRVEFRGTCDHILLSQIPGYTFRRLLRLAGLRWRYSIAPPHGITPSHLSWPGVLVVYPMGGPPQKTPFLTILVLLLAYSLQQERVY
jgi:hypothetical protein